MHHPGIFPEADKDPVIQIANMVIRQGDHEPFIRNVFTLNTCAPVVGSQVLSFSREQDLLNVRTDFIFPSFKYFSQCLESVCMCKFCLFIEHLIPIKSLYINIQTYTTACDYSHTHTMEKPKYPRKNQWSAL